MARPKKVIDYALVESLAKIQCTEAEISSILNVSARTLQRDKEFCRIYKKGLEDGRMSLRRTQFKLAERSTAMAIFLGKQYLGQTDDPQDMNEAKVNLMKAQTEKITHSDLDIEDLSDIESRIYTDE